MDKVSIIIFTIFLFNIANCTEAIYYKNLTDTYLCDEKNHPVCQIISEIKVSNKVRNCLEETLEVEGLALTSVRSNVNSTQAFKAYLRPMEVSMAGFDNSLVNMPMSLPKCRVIKT